MNVSRAGAAALAVFASMTLTGADAAPVSKQLPFVSVANGRSLDVDRSRFSDMVLVARTRAQLEPFTKYLAPQSEARERLQQLRFDKSAIVAIARGLPDGRAIRVVRLARTGDTLKVTAEIWPIPRFVFVTGTIVFTFDAVKVSKRALGRPLPRRVSFSVRRVKP